MRHVVEFVPKNANAYSNWGSALLDLKRPQEAIEKLDPKYAIAHRNRAIALTTLGRPTEAEKRRLIDERLSRP